MHRKGCREPRTSELPDDIEDTRIVGSLPDESTKVRCVKLTVCAWRSLDLIEQFTLFWIKCPLRRWSGFRARRGSRCGAPPTHKAEQEACRNPAVASRPVKREEAIPDHLRVDVPAG